MAMLLLRQGKFDEASARIGQLLAAEPENTETLIFQAEVLRLQGKYREAIESYHRVLRLKPDTHEVANRLAWMLATHPDPGVRNGEEALQLARHACDATGNQAPNFLDTLAAACAETGRFAEAVTVARRAVDLLKASGDQTKLREVENRLRLYELGQPFHERGRKAEEAR
jgi:serine/threonine-protein kinase